MSLVMRGECSNTVPSFGPSERSSPLVKVEERQVSGFGE